MGRALIPPTITTERLILSPYTMEDSKAISDQIDDPSVVRFTLNIPHPYTEKDFKDFYEKNIEWLKEGTHLNLCIRLKESKKGIGGIGLNLIEENNDNSQIGYWIARSYRGRGYVSEAVKALVSYAFREMGLHRIEAVIFRPNEDSRNVLKRCGFLPEGIMRERYRKKGKRFDGEIYSRLSTDPDI